MKNLLTIGKIGSAYGILGWNFIHSYTEEKHNILKYQPWFINTNDKWTKIYIIKKKISKKIIYVQLQNINNRNQSKELINKIIKIKKKQLPILEKSEYYWKDIINCSVLNKDNKIIGKVSNIIRSKINDILIIKNDNYHTTDILIPFIKNIFIKNIDLLNKNIYIK